jgi:3-isopropylmalate/(R)-2-methylmalate dehydratase small subunit
VSFEPFTILTGTAVPLMLPNVDTDVIIRVDRMGSRSPADLAPWAFEALRYLPDGKLDPDSLLNQARYAGAPILLAGANFGCGSSREPAVWAVQGLGVRCVVAPSYGDIFKVNCQQNGVLAVVLPADEVDRLAALAQAGVPLTVDLPAERISAGSETWRFEVATMQKHSLLAGLDDLELTLSAADDVTAWEKADRDRRPWAWAPTAKPRLWRR